MQPAGPTLKKIFGEALRREGQDAPLLAWPLACGSRTAERTSAVSFADGVLTVSVPDETWRRQLLNFSPQYLTALNQLSPEPVKKIEFVTAR
jgi:hypothetical protein